MAYKPWRFDKFTFKIRNKASGNREMLEFAQFVERHGEIAAQALLENLERFEGIPSNRSVPLEQRWNKLIAEQSSHYMAA